MLQLTTENACKVKIIDLDGIQRELALVSLQCCFYLSCFDTNGFGIRANHTEKQGKSHHCRWCSALRCYSADKDIARSS
jgi:hypothetical protein